MLRDIEDKVDKVVITEKEYKKIDKWVSENITYSGIDNVLNKRMFFPLKTFVFEMRAKNGIAKCLVELDSFNPVKGGRLSTDRFWYTWKREYRGDKGGFQFDGQGLTERAGSETHRFLMDCLIYICMAERTIEYRPVVERARETGYEPYEYKERECFLLKDIIRYTGTHKNKKSIQYRCECWGVRGHLRHHDNGKVSFVHPFKKGKKRDVLEPRSKTYLLGEE